MSAPPVFRLQGVRCGYHGRTAFQCAALEIHAGERVGVIGRNGAGKSTLLRALGRLLRPAQGEVRLFGRDLYRELDARAAARAIAAVPQEARIDFAFTALMVVSHGRTPHRGRFGAASTRDQRAVAEAMEQTGTWALRARLVTELSGGELRRVLLARALAQEAAVLLLDEPTVHLDPWQLEQWRSLVRGLPGTVVTVTHDLELAQATCTRLLLVEDGAVAADGDPASVLGIPALMAVRR